MSKKHQSKSLKKLALDNINAKHKIIKKWIDSGIPYLYDDDGNPVRDGNGEMVLDFHPTSLRTFYSWNGEQNCLNTQNTIGSISGTGTTTLDNHPELKRDIVSKLKILGAKAAAQLASGNKTAASAKLKSELQLTRLQRDASEQKYLSIIQQHEKLKNTLRKEQRAHEQSKMVLNKQLETNEREIIRLQGMLSELRKTIEKVSTLKPVK